MPSTLPQMNYIFLCILSVPLCTDHNYMICTLEVFIYLPQLFRIFPLGDYNGTGQSQTQPMSFISPEPSTVAGMNTW